MPIPIQESSFRLDRIVTAGSLRLGLTDDAGVPAFSVRRILGPESLDDLVLDWFAVPVDATGTAWALYVEILTRDGPLTSIPDVVWWPLDGVFPNETRVRINGVDAEVDSLESVPDTLQLAKPLWDNAEIDAGTGDASFTSGRDGITFDERGTFNSSQPVVLAGLVVRLRTAIAPGDFDKFDPAIAVVAIEEDGTVNYQVEDDRSIWAQLIETSVTALDVPDGAEVSESTFEEVRVWVVRTELAGSDVIIDETLRFGVSEIRPLDRRGHWAVTGTRRFLGLTL